MVSRFQSLLEQLPLFKDRSRSEIEALLQGAEDKVSKHREYLFRAGESATSFFVVLQGAFKLIRSNSEGQDAIMHFATPGDLIAVLMMPIPHSRFPVSAVSMGHSIVLKIPRETFTKHWALSASMQQFLGSNIFSRMNQFQTDKALGKSPLPQKIARQIVSLIERYSGENETILPIPLTRQEIADSVGASVESVIRVMSDWSQKGFISTSDQLIEILRMDKILEIIKGSNLA